MIPEIFLKFEVIDYWRKKRDDLYEERKYVFTDSNMMADMLSARLTEIDTALDMIDLNIDALKCEINVIAREHGNSYYDKDGKIVWVPSKIGGK